VSRLTTERGHLYLTTDERSAGSLVRVPEVLEELRDVVREHVVHGLHQLGLHLLELVDVVPTQHLLEVLNVREVSGWKMVLPLDLFQQFEFRCKQVKIMEKKIMQL
jgi:formylmethanofuran dehydrogenase subunit A